jgi:hypothetical protein
MNMRTWQMRRWKHIIHVVGRVSVEGACTLTGSLETKTSVGFAMPMEIAKQRKSVFRK